MQNVKFEVLKVRLQRKDYKCSVYFLAYYFDFNLTKYINKLLLNIQGGACIKVLPPPDFISLICLMLMFNVFTSAATSMHLDQRTKKKYPVRECQQNHFCYFYKT